MGRDQTPSADAEQRPAPVDNDDRHPQCRLDSAIDERGADEHADRNGGDGTQAEDRTPKRRIVATGHHEQGDVTQPHHPVGDGEGDGTVTERLGDAEPDHEQAGHRAEDDDPDRAFLGFDDARQPRVAHPRPPDHGEGEHPPADTGPVGLGHHQRGALGEREHEDEIEEQLERSDRLPLAQFHPQPRRMAPACPTPSHRLSVGCLCGPGHGRRLRALTRETVGTSHPSWRPDRRCALPSPKRANEEDPGGDRLVVPGDRRLIYRRGVVELACAGRTHRRSRSLRLSRRRSLR